MANIAFKTYVQALTNKTTPTGADSLVIIDSADSNNDKETTITGIYNYVKSLTDVLYAPASLSTSKQDTLVSGTNIKTINSTSLLGSGDIVISGAVSDGDKGDITVSNSGTVWNIDAATIGVTELSATGTPSSSTYLRGDNTWSTVSGTGDVVGPASAVNNNFVAFDTTTGKLIKDSGSKASDFAVALTSDQNYVSDAQLTVIGNTSGTNTGDNATNSQYSGLASSKAELAGSTSQAFSASQLEVGNTDTTITRSAAGVIAVEGIVIPSISSTNLFTNKTYRYNYAAKTTTYGITTTDHVINCTTGTFTVTLPTAVGVSGQEYIIKNTGTGVITVATTSSQTIDGVTTATINVQYESLSVISDGANWIVC